MDAPHMEGFWCNYPACSEPRGVRNTGGIRRVSTKPSAGQLKRPSQTPNKKCRDAVVTAAKPVIGNGGESADLKFARRAFF